MSHTSESPAPSGKAPVPAAKPSPPPFPIVFSVLSAGVIVVALISERAGATAKPESAAPATAEAPAPATAPTTPAPATAEAPAPATAPTAAPATAGVEELKALKGEIDALVQRVDRLQKDNETRIAALSESRPTSDFKPLAAKVDELGKLSEQVATLPRRVGELDDRIGSLGKDLGLLRSEVASLQDEIKRSPEPAAVPNPDGSAGSEPGIQAALAAGAALFQQRKFADALAAFQVLQKAHPEDARVWYYSALASGYATGKWADGEAVRLVEKGVEREKAGTPAGTLIDAAFGGLSKATGKDWLGYYRQKARK